jgi:hypothetical protein
VLRSIQRPELPRLPRPIRLLALLLPALLALQAAAAPGRAAPTEATPSLDVILERHLEALGGREAVFAPRALHVRGTVTAAGIQGTMEGWISGDDRTERFRQEVDLGLLSMTIGTDGTDWWRVDNNGRVGNLSGAELEMVRSTLFIGDYLYLRPEAEMNVGLVGVEEKDGRRTYVIEVSPPGGKARRIWIDAETYLPYGYRDSLMGIDMFVHLDDYRDVGGVMIPFLTETEAENPLFDQTLQYATVEVVQDIDPALFARPGPAPRDFRFEGSAASTELPMILHGNHVFVPVTLDGSVEAEFLLDTGAGATCLMPRLARELGLETEGNLGAVGVGGTGSSRLSHLGRLRVGGLELRDQRVVVIDLSGLEEAEGRAIDGVLGYDFFRRVVVDLDYEGRKVLLHDPKRHRPGPGAVRLPLSLEFNIPVVRATLEDSLEAPFIVDTGNAHDLLLHFDFVREHALLRPSRPSALISSMGVGGRERMALVHMESLRLGPLEIRDLLVVLPRNDRGASGIDLAAGNIGGGVLRRYRVAFDYDGGEMILYPPGGAQPVVSVEISGAILEQESGGLRVLMVLEGSPAETAGLSPGDLVLELAGRDCSRIDRGTLEELLGTKDGETVPVRLAREGERLSTSLRIGRSL